MPGEPSFGALALFLWTGMTSSPGMTQVAAGPARRQDGSFHVLGLLLALLVAACRLVPQSFCPFLSIFGPTRASTAASAVSEDGQTGTLFLFHREAFPGHLDSPSSLPGWQDLCVACLSASSKLGTSFGEERVWKGAASSLTNASGAAGAPRP